MRLSEQTVLSLYLLTTGRDLVPDDFEPGEGELDAYHGSEALDLLKSIYGSVYVSQEPEIEALLRKTGRLR